MIIIFFVFVSLQRRLTIHIHAHTCKLASRKLCHMFVECAWLRWLLCLLFFVLIFVVLQCVVLCFFLFLFSLVHSTSFSLLILIKCVVVSFVYLHSHANIYNLICFLYDFLYTIFFRRCGNSCPFVGLRFVALAGQSRVTNYAF